MSPPLLEVRDLSVTFPVGGWPTPSRLVAASEIRFSVQRGEIVALVGESGSGKSTIGRAVARLQPVDRGQIYLDGVDALAAEPRGPSRAWRRRVQMIFQDPFGSLNPAHTVGRHVARPLQLHGRAPRRELRARTLALLESAGLAPAADFIDAHPHALSGGQRQRVAIARALAADPDLLIADEPTSMLDVSIRVGVLQLLRSLRDSRGLGVIFITHDLAAARFLADRILVLYAGQLQEVAPSRGAVADPAHPYTRLLMAAAPRPGGSVLAPLPAGPGAPPVIDPPPGCAFAARCPEAYDRCRRETPALHGLGPDRSARCHLYDPSRRRDG